MAVHQQALLVPTSGRGFIDLSRQLGQAVAAGPVREGLCSLFIRHTSASLIVGENADPDVLVDLETWLSDLVKDGDLRFRHRAEGNDDMAAHVRSVLTATSLTLPIQQHRLQLGTWQAVYLWEHRYEPHQRSIDLTLLGE